MDYTEAFELVGVNRGYRIEIADILNMTKESVHYLAF